MSRDKKKGGSVATFFRRVKSDKRKRGQLIGSLFVFVLAFSFGWQLVQVSRTGITNNLDLIMMAAENIFSVSVPQGADMQETISLCARNVISGLLVAVAAQLIYWACVMYSNLGRKNYRPGEEYGSAKKGQIIDAEQLAAQNNPDPDPEKRDPKNDIILSKQIRLDMDTWHTRLNNNIFVVGGSGSGKTRFFVKPNVLQLSSNYIVIDPKGSVAEETGHAFEEAGYEISYLNLVDFSKSMCWNPFVYFHSPEDVQNFVKNLIDNTSDKNQTGGDEFFTKAEITCLTAVIFYIMATAQGTGRCNMNTVMLMLDHSKAVEEDEDYKSEVDLMFEELEDEIRRRSDGRSEFSYAELAVRNYKIFKMGAGKTAKSILISLGVRLSVFNLPALRRIMEKDDLHLERFGEPMVKSLNAPEDLSKDLDRDTFELVKNEKGIYYNLPKDRLRKKILFVIISDSSKTFAFLSSIILEQLYAQLYLAADSRKDHKLPIHTRFINDEFPNCGKQPDFNRKISTMRSREISTAVIVQGISQIKSKSLYGDEWEAIFENCDTTLYLGSKGPTTLQEFQKLAGKETVALRNQSVTKGRNSSVSESTQYLTRDLYDYAELGKLPGERCLVHIKGHDIFEDDKYDVKNHPNVGMTMDAAEKEDAAKNHFDVAVYLETAKQIESSRAAKKQREYRKANKDALEKGELFAEGEDLWSVDEEIFITPECLQNIQDELDDEVFDHPETFYPHEELPH